MSFKSGWKAPLLFLHLTLVLGDDACEATSLLQALKATGFSHFKGTANETKQKYGHLLTGATELFPYDVMTCQGEQTVETKGMTSKKYDEIVQKVQDLYETLDATCEADNCPRAEWSGCVLRIAGHDFMDYNPKTGTGGSDGCMDLTDPDNGGLATCLYTGAEFGISVADAYQHFCTEVSLADFLVIAAQAMIQKTRQNALDVDPSLAPINLKDIFQWGRTTAKKCSEAHGVLPNPEASCRDVKRVFVDNMGLNWRRITRQSFAMEATALMGVHTLGKCRIENSGYDGWWSNVGNSFKFNNNYYIAVGAKGWIPELKIAGNPNKNQWKLGDYEKYNQEKRGKQMMLNTDLCLAFTNDRYGRVDLNAATGAQYGCHCAWMGPLEAYDGWQKYNKGKFCGTTDVPDDFSRGWRRQRNICCGVYDPYGYYTDCGLPQNPLGPAVGHVESFMNDEPVWLSEFKPAWQTAITNGFQGKLKKLS